MVRLLLLLSALFISASHASAQGSAKVQLALEPRSGTINDSFLFSVIINGGSKVSYPYLVGGDDFKLALIGPQTSMRIENGVTTTQTAYNYRLIPKQAGTLRTPGAEVEMDGVKHRAEPLSVQIAQAGGRIAKVDKYFIVQSFDKRSAYVGEQIIGTIELYTSVELDDLHYSDLSFDGFWSEDLGKSETFERVIEGKRYTVLRIRRALYPLVPGKMTVPARELKAKAVTGFSRRRPSSAFDFDRLDPFNPNFLGDFFGRKVYEPVVLTSNPLSIEIKPLPAPPANITSARGSVLVGHTSVSVNYEPGDIAVGESKNLKVTVTSYGNIGTYKDLPLTVPQDIKVYDEAPSVSPIESDGKLITRKTFSMSLVPTAPGEIVVPPVEVPYFDPASSQYKLAKGPEARFRASGQAIARQPVPTPPGVRAPAGSSTEPAERSGERQSAAEKPRELYEAPSTVSKLTRLASPSLVMLAVAVLALGAYVAILIRRLRAERKPAKDLLSRVDDARDADELADAFRDFLSQRLGVPGSDLRTAVRARLRDPELLFAIQSTLDLFDELRYGRRSSDPEIMDSLKTSIRSVARSV